MTKRKAKVVIRRGKGWNVRPEAEELDGQILELTYGWAITINDRPHYAGEVAWMTPAGTSLPWIASGDLEFIDEDTAPEDEGYGVRASTMDGNASNRHANPDAWDRWVEFSEGWGHP